MAMEPVVRVLAGLLLLAEGGCRPRVVPAPRSVDGLWEGSMAAGGEAHLIRLAFASDSSGLTGRVDVPDQYAVGYPVTSLRWRDSVLAFALPGALPPAAFTGLVERGRIRGTFISATGPDTVRGTFELWRRPPETPPYHAHEVRFANGEVPLRGTLFLPAGAGRSPAVILLHGSGPQTRESYLRYFAQRFARRGVAALIYDKRNTGRSDIPLHEQGAGTFGDLAGDAAAAVRYLATRPEIDTARVGLWGLSQGAWLVPLAASRLPGVAFAVLVSGGGVTPAEQELYDDEVKLRARGYPAAVVDTALGLLRQADQYVRTGTDADWRRLQASLGELRGRPWFPLLDRFPLVLPRAAPVWSGLRPDLDHDPGPALRALRAPALVLLGERDALTPVEETARRIERELRAAGHRDFTIRIVPGADHGLAVRAVTGPGWLGHRPAPGWIDQMLDWVVQRTDPARQAAGSR